MRRFPWRFAILFVGSVSALGNPVTNGGLWDTVLVSDTHDEAGGTTSWHWIRAWSTTILFVRSINTVDKMIALFFRLDAVSVRALELILSTSSRTIRLVICFRTVHSIIAESVVRDTGAISTGELIALTACLDWILSACSGVLAIAFVAAVETVSVVVAEEVLVDADAVVALSLAVPALALEFVFAVPTVGHRVAPFVDVQADAVATPELVAAARGHSAIVLVGSIWTVRSTVTSHAQADANSVSALELVRSAVRRV